MFNLLFVSLLYNLYVRLLFYPPELGVPQLPLLVVADHVRAHVGSPRLPVARSREREFSWDELFVAVKGASTVRPVWTVVLLRAAVGRSLWAVLVTVCSLIRTGLARFQSGFPTTVF